MPYGYGSPSWLIPKWYLTRSFRQIQLRGLTWHNTFLAEEIIWNEFEGCTMGHTKYLDFWTEGKRVGGMWVFWRPFSLVHKGTLCVPSRVHPQRVFCVITLSEVQVENKISKDPSKVVKSVKKGCRKKSLPSEKTRPTPSCDPSLWRGQEPFLTLYIMTQLYFFSSNCHPLYKFNFNVHLINFVSVKIWVYLGLGLNVSFFH